MTRLLHWWLARRRARLLVCSWCGGLNTPDSTRGMHPRCRAENEFERMVW